MYRAFLAALFCLFSAITFGTASYAASPGDCSAFSIGDTTAVADTVFSSLLGYSIGETITLSAGNSVSEVAAFSAFGVGQSVIMYILETDSLGAPIWSPALASSGPMLVPGDPNAATNRITFEFDPPFSAPRDGVYCLLFRLCDFVGGVGLRASTQRALAPGRAWVVKASRTYCQSPSSGALGQELPPSYGPLFALQACESTTPTRRVTWGTLKSAYH